MKDLISFINQNKVFVVIIIAIACVLFGRIWSNILNWGVITEPHLVIKKGKYYKLVNLYLPKAWTEDWIVDSIVCLKSYHRRFFFKYSKEIYVSGDRIRFTNEDGPIIGLLYQAIFSKNASGSIIMKPIQTPKKV